VIAAKGGCGGRPDDPEIAAGPLRSAGREET